jgi:CubicO group peptidase (beta-lactamase class C family)
VLVYTCGVHETRGRKARSDKRAYPPFLLPAAAMAMLLAGVAAVSNGAPQARGKPSDDRPPVTGEGVPGVELFDQVMLAYLDKIGCTAATLAISSSGALVVSRGYGWCDKEKTVPTQPNTIIGLASCEKSFTAAAIRKLAACGRLNLDAPLLALLRIRPHGDVTDPRVYSITVRHLIDHRAGWGGNPAAEAVAAARSAGLKEPFSPEDLLSFIMTRKLQNAPGQKDEYCNFGYDTLRQVIVRATDRPYSEYFQRELFRPLVVTEIRGPGDPHGKQDPPIVWNAADGGPVGASAPAMCLFMRRYWYGGEPRNNGNPLWIRYGSLPGSTAIMIWRSDGIDIAALFNGRHNDVSHDEISQAVQQVIEQMKKGAEMFRKLRRR